MEALADFIGESPAVQTVRDQIARLLARGERGHRLPSILMTGETGTGKGLVARMIHRHGPRAGAPFVDLNCAAIPETLLEAELFGFERGAFTDARRSKLGLFQAAHRGIIFLDEIGLLPQGLQAKLLKVLEEQAVRRLGATTVEPVDVWVISATNADLQAEVRGHAFREDLYHRLAVLTLRLPPLRERGRDVLILAERFLARVCADYGLPPKRFAPDVSARLLAYRWPGNVRELNNVIERVALLSEDDVVAAEALELRAGPAAEPVSPSSRSASGRLSFDDAMRAHLLAALNETGWNISRTSGRLGISRNTLRARIERLGLKPTGDSVTRGRSVARARPVTAPRVAREAPSRPMPSTLRWEQRRITLLRSILVTPSGMERLSSTSRALDVLVDKVRAFGGCIEELSSTGLVASFGLEQVEDAPRRAALAALAMQRVSDRVSREDPLSPRLRSAIHVAEARVACGADYAKIDAEEERSLRTTLETLAASSRTDDVIVSAAAAPFLERRFDLTVETRIGSDSKSYRLTGRERKGFEFLGRIGTFVGRRQELDLLKDRLGSAVEGRGQVVALVGEPGVGKSRLAWEFVRSHGRAVGLVLEAAASPHGRAVPFLPIRDVLRGYFQIQEDDSPDQIAAKVTAAVKELDDGLAFSIPAIQALLEATVDDLTWPKLEPAQRRQQTLDGITRLLIRESRRRPVLLVLEDLHWIDSETESLLSVLVVAIPAARIMLLVTCRPDYRHDWGGTSSYTQLGVAPLPTESAQELLDALLGQDSTVLPVKSRLIEWAGGNPFFLEESSRTLVETGVLTGDRGAYRLAKPLSHVQVPATVQEVVAARVARLSEGGKEVLDCAAIIGRDVALSLLKSVTALMDADVFHRMQELQVAELLYETGSFPNVEYAFKHALTHEVTYRLVAPERRRELHGKVVEALERIAPDDVQQFGYHAFRAEQWSKALRYLRQAGLKAADQAANREAVALFEQSLEALAHLPEAPDVIEQAIDLRFDIRNALQPLGDLSRILEYLSEAESLAAGLGDERRLGWVASYLTEHYRMLGDTDRAAAVGRRALDIADRLGDVAMQVVTRLPLGLLYRALGEYRRAVEFLRWNTARLQGDLLRERFGLFGLPSVFSRTFSVQCLAELGEFTEGAVLGAESIRLAEAVDQPFSRVYAYLGVGALYLRKGDFARAIGLLENSVAIARATYIPVGFVYAAPLLGYALALAGRPAEGLPLLQEAVDQSARMKLMAGHSVGVAYLGEGYLLSGRVTDAASAAAQALELALDHRERGNEAYARRLAAEVSAARGDVAAAATRYLEALALAEELAMRPFQAHCHWGLARVLRRSGPKAAVESHLAAARALFSDMEMLYWEERLVGECAEAG